MNRNLLFLVAGALAIGCSGPSGDDEDPEGGDPCEEPGNICTWLGIPGVARVSAEGVDRLQACTYLPQDVDFASDGTAYFPDFNNHRIRRVNLDGTVETVSGTTMLGDGPNTAGSASNCWAGCDALDSAWNHPTQLAVDPSDEDVLYVAAWHNSRINVLDLEAGTMTWYAGTGARNYAPGGDTEADPDPNPLNELWMDLPSSIAFDADGVLYYSDQANHMIRRILPDGTPEDVAGQPRHAGHSGDGGPAIEAELHGHTDQKADPGSKLAIDGRLLYLADTANGVIRRIDLDTGVIETVAGKFTSSGEAVYKDAITGVEYTADAGSVPGYGGDGGDALEAVFATPRDVAIGLDGEVYVADTKNNCVRVLYPDGTIDRFAGRCGEEGAYGGDEGPALEAEFDGVFGVGVDPEGNVYVADSSNHVIRRVKR